MSHPLTEQLIEAQLNFLDQEFAQADQIENEFLDRKSVV